MIKLETLDERIKYYPLFLVRNTLDDIKEYPLKDGYYYQYYKNGDRDCWIEIGMHDGEFRDYEEGLKTWNFYYASHEDELKNRLIFLKKDDEYVGTATAYYDVKGIDDPSIGRLHWVGIKREYQGLGLGKPLISHTLNLMKELGYEKAKISTQPNSWLACSIYLDFGFVPTEENREGWNIVKTITNHPALKDYDYTDNIFNE